MIKKILQACTWYLWVTPFIAFLIGYGFCYLWIANSEIVTPNLIGKTVHEGVVLLSSQRLSMRVRAEREDESVPAGTILDQFPKSDRLVKPNQSIYVTVSKSTPPAIIPDFCGKTEQQIQVQCQKLDLDVLFHHVSSHHQKGKCVAHYPQAGELAYSRKIIALIAAPQDDACLIPSFKGLPVEKVKHWFEQENIVLEVFHQQNEASHSCKDCTIVSQRPAAGTVVRSSERLVLQLRVKRQA